MGPTVALLSFFVVLATGQPAGQKPCCESKEVGGVKYMLTGTMDTKAYGCITNCLYETKAKPDMKFCFAPGDLEVECLDDGSSKPPKGDSTKPPKEENSKPPMDGSSKPPMEGSSKPPMDKTSKPPMEETSKPGMSPTDGMPGMSTMDGGMKPTGGVTGGDPNTVGPTKGYTPVFTCKGSLSYQTDEQDKTLTKITCRDDAGVITKEGEIRCSNEIQTTSTSTEAGQESKLYCCPDCPPMATMNMPTFDFDFGPKF